MTSPALAITLNISAQSLPQLFEKTVHELLKVLVNPNDVGEVLREKIVVEAADSALLLKAWVNALLSLTSDQHILFKSSRFQVFEAERLGAGKLRAEVTGELMDPARHIFLKQAAAWQCGQVQLENGSKSIEAQIIIEPRQIGP